MWRKHLGAAEKYQEIQRHGNVFYNYIQSLHEFFVVVP